MYFIDKRIQVICDNLNKLRIRNVQPVTDWQYKKGFFLYPSQADAEGEAWESFDGNTMHWYGPDEHYWFRGDIVIPDNLEGKSVWMKVRTQIEEWDDGKNPQFLLFLNGKETQGLDMNHREVRLFEHAPAGEKLRVDIQAYTGTLHSEFRFLVELYEQDEAINRLYWDLQVPLRAFSRMQEDGQNRLAIQTVLNDTINLLDLREPYSEGFYASLEKAQAYVTENLYEKMGGWDGVVATCIGHTHIDVAWWWTVAQTQEKVVRSFATVLKLMEEFPSYRFMSSQPVLYYFLKERYPALYERLKERVREGRWEPEGGTWVEPDCNLTSGESLVRQFMHGKRFFKEEFGVDNRILWLPDVFGYSGALPQIMKKSGVDYFMTTKLSWNQIDKVPNDTMMWRGIDGTEVLTHLITTLGTGQPVSNFFTTYNGMLHPDAIMGGWERYQNKEINNDILISYGYGDGGGGPTREMLETSVRMEKGVRGIPKVRQEFSRKFFEELEERVKDNPRLETWEGEFYFEYHRGTYTSMARNKRGNRKSELLLMDLELASVLAAKQFPYPAAELDRMWKTVLINQFHDILPGSSIHEVYEVTKREYAEIAETAGELLRQRLAALAGQGEGVTVFNTTGFARDGVVELGETSAAALCDENGRVFPVQKTSGGAVAFVEGLPAKGWKTFAKANAGAAASPFARTDERHIETPFYRVAFDDHGHLSSLFDKENDRELVQAGKAANMLRMFEDKPIYYDNWDIDMFYTEKSWPVDHLVKMTWVEDGPVRAAVELEYKISLTTVKQKVCFYANSRRIDFETWVDWKQHQHLLKAEFPVDIHSDEATFEIQFGNLTRKVHTNTSWDKARFEVCGQKWMDFSEGHYGVSLLNDCKYGHSVRDGVVSLTLIKSGIEPNPVADQEEHVFTYALYPHAGSWRDAGTVRESYFLNQPARALDAGRPGEAFSLASVEQKNVVLETVKQAENGDGTVLRLYESENARTKTVLHVPAGTAKAYSCNLLEEVEEELPVVDGKVCFLTKPYEIKTILLK
jgi:alpha-mannosidase